MVEGFGASGRYVELVSPLPLDRCRELLAAGINSPWAVLGRRPVIGRMSGTKLQAWKRVGREGYLTWVRAEMVERAEHTHIRCRFSTSWSTILHTVVPCGVVSTIAGLALAGHLLAMVAHPSKASDWTWAEASANVVMFLCGLGMVLVERHYARDERRFLLHFLCRTLDAVPADAHARGEAAASCR